MNSFLKLSAVLRITFQFLTMVGKSSSLFRQYSVKSLRSSGGKILGAGLGGTAAVSACSMISLCQDQNTKTEDVISLQPEKDTHLRIDDRVYDIFGNTSDVEDHAIHGTLNGTNMIEDYKIYHRIGHEEILCLIKFGGGLNGHPGVIHGGITSLVIDNSFGWLFIALKTLPGFTANLNINFRKPVYANTQVALRITLQERTGRKVYMNAVMYDENSEVLADATTLFIMPKTA